MTAPHDAAPQPSRRGLLGAGLALAAGAATSVAAAAPARAAVAPRAPQDGELPGHTPHTRFAMNLEMWWGGKSYVERLNAAADLGFRDVELWAWAGKDLQALADAAAARDVSIAQFTGWGFSPGLADPAHHDEFVRGIDQAIEVAQTLRAPMATVLAGNDVEGLSREQMHANVISALQRVAPLVESAGLMLILEPLNTRVDHRGYCVSTSDDGLAICRAVDSPMVKLNWDLYHQQITEGDLIRRLQGGFDQVGYFQLADNPGRMEPGTGEINYSAVLKAIHELGYRKPIGVECSPSKPESEAAWALWHADQW